MTCHSCSRKTLSLFIRSLIPTRPLSLPPATTLPNRIAKFSSSAAQPWEQKPDRSPTPRHNSHHDNRPRDKKYEGAWKPRPKSDTGEWKPRPYPSTSPTSPFPAKKKERWQIQKAALEEKFGGEPWNPRKKLSLDTMEGIRHLNDTHPGKFTTPLLAQHFKVSPEAIRRILKSRWRPSDEVNEDRTARWEKRGEKIWSNMVELGIKPPKKWREMGVGRAERGGLPTWKSRKRNSVPVHDSAVQEDIEDLIPIVDASGERVDLSGGSSPLGPMGRRIR